MVKVLNYNDRICYTLLRNLFDSIRNLREGYISNLYVDEQTFLSWQSDKLSLISYSKTAFLIREFDGFCNLYYASVSNEQLKEDLSAILSNVKTLPIVVDLIGRDKDMAKLQSPFVENGFTSYCNLMRMSRITTPESAQEGVLYAQPSQAEAVYNLLQSNFNPLCEQLPLLRQVENWIDQKRVLIRVINDHIVGFVIFEINGITSYLRYWWAHPEYRNQKIGSSLLRHFFYESNQTKRQQFWVIQNNDNALVRYQHYGFTAEDMFDQVLILK